MTNRIRPFLKWPGRKYQVIDNILLHLKCPSKVDTLVEPFVGSAAVFLNTNYKNYILNDNNPDLINLYLYLINEGEKFIKYTAKLFISENNSKDKYYELRDKFNNTRSERLKSAVFLYLNRHGFNGLCRYNNKGEYNVPFGLFNKVNLPHKSLLDFYNKAKTVNITINCLDYSELLNNLNNHAIIYCDPPYVPISSSSSFTKYSKVDFNISQQQDLVSIIRKLKQNGFSSYISNHDLTATRKLYHDSKIVSFNVKRMISCKTQERKYVKELLAIYEAE